MAIIAQTAEWSDRIPRLPGTGEPVLVLNGGHTQLQFAAGARKVLSGAGLSTDCAVTTGLWSDALIHRAHSRSLRGRARPAAGSASGLSR